MSFILARLMEASTWRGILFLLTAFGVHVSPEQSTAIITAGAAIIGAASVFLPDSLKPKAPVHQVVEQDEKNPSVG